MDRFSPFFSGSLPKDELAAEWEVIGDFITRFLERHPIPQPFAIHLGNLEWTPTPSVERVHTVITAYRPLHIEPYTAIVWVDDLEVVFHLRSETV